MTIKQLLKNIDREVMTVLPTARVGKAIGSLAQDDTSALIVTTDDQHVLGVLSSSDIVKYLNENGDLPNQTLVSDLMTHDVVSCEATETVERLEQLMIEHQIRHIPITNQDRLCAVVSILDIVGYRRKSAEDEAGELRRYVAGVG